MASVILIVEDEQDLVETMVGAFQEEGYETRTASTGDEALSLAARRPLPDIVLLDWMLPDMSGLEICRRLKASIDTKPIPVVMVTGRGEETERVAGFEVGVDDYVVKPFSMRELLLRVRAVLRRARQLPRKAAPMAFGLLEVDEEAHEVRVAGVEATLTVLEFKLLTTLLRRRGKVQTREALLRDVWGISPEVTTRTVDTHVKRLRQKLGVAGSYVETVRGVGYRLRAFLDDEGGGG